MLAELPEDAQRVFGALAYDPVQAQTISTESFPACASSSARFMVALYSAPPPFFQAVSLTVYHSAISYL
jgi:hypothetical protein